MQSIEVTQGARRGRGKQNRVLSGSGVLSRVQTRNAQHSIIQIYDTS